MKTASTALKALLTGGDFVYCDLYSFTLPGGDVIRLCGGDRLIGGVGVGELVTDTGARLITDTGAGFAITVSDGTVYPLGCAITDGGVKARIGLDAEPVSLSLYGDATTAFHNGVALQPFLRANGLNGASIRIDRAYALSWQSMAQFGPTGTINRFSGLFGAVTSLSRTQATIDAYPVTWLMNANMPPNVYQASCLHVLFDIGCGLHRADFAVTGTVGTGATQVVVPSNLTTPAGDFTLGKIAFTSGANAGLQRTVKLHDSSGAMTLIQPLPASPASGDTFTAWPGCDLSEARCTSRFNNRIHFRGFPKVPPPEASL